MLGSCSSVSVQVHPGLGSGSSGPVGVVPELVLPALASAVRLLLAAAAWQPGQPTMGLGGGWRLAVAMGLQAAVKEAVSRLQLAFGALRNRLGQ